MKDCDSSLGASEKYSLLDKVLHRKHRHNMSAFFFGHDDTVDTLHKTGIFGLNHKGTKCATDLQDQQLLAELSAGDLVEQDAKYHLGCLVPLYNRAAAEKARKGKQNTTDNLSKSIALAELLT